MKVQERNPGLLGFLLGSGKLLEGSSCCWDELGAASVGCPGDCCSQPHLLKRSWGERQSHTVPGLISRGGFRGAQTQFRLAPLPLASCQLLQARAESRVIPDPACALPSPLPKQGSAAGSKQSWKLGTEARSRKEPSLLFCAWVGFCTAVGSTNMFPICLLH